MKLWATSRRVNDGLTRYTWRYGRTKLLTVLLHDHQNYIWTGEPFSDGKDLYRPYVNAGGKPSFHQSEG